MYRDTAHNECNLMYRISISPPVVIHNLKGYDGPFPDTYDSSLPNQNLVYLEANSLYEWAMSQSLPTHGFRFLQQDVISTL